MNDFAKLQKVMRTSTNIPTEIPQSVVESPLLVALEEAMGVQPAGYPLINRVAVSMGMPIRTLQRRLIDVGLTYSRVVEIRRQREACRKLSGTGQSIAHIAATLGYSDPSSFSRAFKRWSNMSPSDYRRQLDDEPLS